MSEPPRPGPAGRVLPTSSPYAADDGSADPALAAVLAEHAAGRASVADVLAALAGTRVLVAILPHGREITPEQEAVGVTGQASVIGFGTDDGRAAMPVFTSVTALAAWRSDARPVPTPVAQAAHGAVAENWPLLVLDPAGPVTVRLPRPAVLALADGRTWRPAVADGAVDDEVTAAVAATLGGIDEVAGCRLVPGEQAEVAIELALRPGLDRAALDAVVARVNEALAADAVVAERVDSIELRLRTAS